MRIAILKAKYRRQLEHNPVAMRELGRILIKEGKTDEGVAMLLRAWHHGDISFVPEYSKLLFNSLTPTDRVEFIKSTENGVRIQDPQAYFYYSLLIRDGFVAPDEPNAALNWLEASANKDFQPAKALLALHYAKLGEVDHPRMNELLEQPLKLGIPEALYAKGLILEDNNDAHKALKYYQSAASMGLNDAQLAYAQLLMKLADNNAIDYQAKHILYWFKRAARNGNFESRFAYARLLVEGRSFDYDEIGVDSAKSFNIVYEIREDPRALQLFVDHYEQFKYTAPTGQRLDMLALAHDHNIEKGTAILASWLQNGDAGVKDPIRAIQMFNELSSHGKDNLISKNDMFSIALAYHNGATTPAVDTRLAAKWYEKAALRGHVESQRIIANSYMFGKLGFTRDVSKAKEFYYLAAKQHDLRSKVTLGKIIRFNDPIGTEYEKKNWYELAIRESRNGFPELQLGKLYWTRGRYSLSTRYYSESVVKGNAEGMNALGLAYENGHGVTKDLTRAAEYFTVSAIRNTAGAFYNLGRCYEYGIGVEPNKDLAYAYYKHAESAFRHRLAHMALQRFDPSQPRQIYDVQKELQQAAQHVMLDAI
jgi:TPR repeat protein